MKRQFIISAWNATLENFENLKRDADLRNILIGNNIQPTSTTIKDDTYYEHGYLVKGDFTDIPKLARIAKEFGMKYIGIINDDSTLESYDVTNGEFKMTGYIAYRAESQSRESINILIQGSWYEVVT